MITLVGDGNKTAVVVFQLAEHQEKAPELKCFCLLHKPSREDAPGEPNATSPPARALPACPINRDTSLCWRTGDDVRVKAFSNSFHTKPEHSSGRDDGSTAES